MAAAVSVWGVVKAGGERWAEREHSAQRQRRQLGSDAAMPGNNDGIGGIRLLELTAQQRGTTGRCKQPGTDPVEPDLAFAGTQVAGGAVRAEAVKQLAA